MNARQQMSPSIKGDWKGSLGEFLIWLIIAGVVAAEGYRHSRYSISIYAEPLRTDGVLYGLAAVIALSAVLQWLTSARTRDGMTSDEGEQDDMALGSGPESRRPPSAQGPPSPRSSKNWRGFLWIAFVACYLGLMSILGYFAATAVSAVVLLLLLRARPAGSIIFALLASVVLQALFQYGLNVRLP